MEIESAGAVAVPGWYSDPTRRNQLRYWDGAIWTHHVANGDMQSVDAIVAPVRASNEATGEAVAAAREDEPVDDAATEAAVAMKFAMRRQLNATAGWLFGIAAFTAANAFLWLTQSNVRMVVGLISTRLFIRFTGTSPVGEAAETAAVLAAAGVFVVLGLFARQGKTWAIWTGVGIYGADLAVYLAVLGTSNVISLGIRAVALVALVRGGLAIKALREGRIPAASLMESAPSQQLSWKRLGLIALATVGGFVLMIVGLVVAIVLFAK